MGSMQLFLCQVSQADLISLADLDFCSEKMEFKNRSLSAASSQPVVN